MYSPEYFGSKDYIIHPPLGRFLDSQTVGGNYDQGQIVDISKPGDIPFDPYAPPPPGATQTIKQAGDIPFDPYAPPPPGATQTLSLIHI